MKTLTIKRFYLPNSTLGRISNEAGTVICYTIERPYLHNERVISCIPEGLYSCVIEYHDRLKKVYRLLDVPNRSGILIHAANRVEELKGCIAPVSEITRLTEGSGSMKALQSIFDETQSQPFQLYVIR
jgi:hypothetical protein